VDAECAPLNNMLVLVVGGLPIAMPTILSVTMALGASALAKKKAIVSRLTAVEEIAGYTTHTTHMTRHTHTHTHTQIADWFVVCNSMEVLCSDKTGTLTKNELSISNPVAYVGEVPLSLTLAHHPS
jgi:H+-transporting ATPase